MEIFPRWKQVVYANGYGGFSILDNIFGIYYIFFLLPPIETGLPELISSKSFYGITTIGIIIVFGRIIDSIADPLIAYWSDRTKSSLGRRRFFMLTGSLPFALISFMLFTLPDQHATTANTAYAAVTLGLYFFFYTYYMAPYLALIPELTRSHEERIFVTIIQAVFMLFGAAVVMMGVPALWDALGSTIPQKDEAFRAAIGIVAAIGFVSSISAALVVDEKRYSKGEPAEISIIQSIKMTLGNRSFIYYMIPVILYWFTFHMIRSTIAYYPMVLIHQPASFQTMLMVLLFGGAALFFVLISMLSKKYSNKTIMLSGMLTFALFLCITYFIDTLVNYPVSIAGIETTGAVVLACLQMFLIGYPVSVLLVIPNAMVADISEVDADMRGMNREAMFLGTQGLFMKINYGIAAAIIAALFATFGKDVATPLGVKLSGPVAALFALAGFLILFKYPQDWISDKLNAIREREGS